MNDKVLALIEQTDTLLKTSEDATIERINTALERSYKQLERDLLKAYQKHAENKSLLPLQRKLLIMSEIKDLMQLLNPKQASQIRKDFEALLKGSYQSGVDLTGQLTQAIANEELKSFVKVPLDAVRFQAEESGKRLSRYAEDFASRISGIVEFGLIQGWGSQKVARQIRGELGVTKGKAEMLARTESISSLDSATRANYKENGIDLVQRIAVEDSRTCGYCLARDGNVYEVTKAPAAIHPSDRCYNQPLKIEWIEAGLIDLEWSKRHKAEIQKKAGVEPNYGAAPFEKLAGAAQPIKPVYTLGDLDRLAKTGVKTLPPNHVVSLNPKYTAEAFDKALDQISSKGASERVQQFRQFVANQGIQTVIYDKKSSEAEQLKLFREEIQFQEDWTDAELKARTIPKNPDIEGFTGQDRRHIVVGATAAEFKPTSEGLNTAIGYTLLMAEAEEGEVTWGISDNADEASDHDFIVYLHEMGHQVHYAADLPSFPDEIAGSITEYGSRNEREWFAEHFAAWMLDAEDYAKLDPVGAKFIEDSFKRALNEPRRLT